MRQCPACLREYDDAFGACPHDGTALRADPLVGTVVDGKYRVDAFIGKGAMGGVYRATQLALDRPVAVKVMPPRFHASLDNPNMCKVGLYQFCFRTTCRSAKDAMERNC